MTDSFIKKLIGQNRGPKLAALAIALVCWYAIQAVINFETVVSDVPLVIKLDQGWAILDRSAQTVDVTFRGAQEDIRLLNISQIKVLVDLRGRAQEGTQTIRLRPKYVVASGAARAVSIRPEEITLSLDRESAKEVPVKAELQGSLPDGYEVDSFICSPSVVTLMGPKTRLGEVDILRTTAIDIEGRTRTFKKLKASITPPSESWEAKISPESVAVEVKIVERAATRQFTDVPLAIMFDADTGGNFELQPTRVAVLLRGRSELLQKMKAKDVQAYVDVRGLRQGTMYELPVRIVAPPGVVLVSTEPGNVKVTSAE